MSETLIEDPTFSKICAEYQLPIHRYVRSLVRDTGEAEDITQETFLRAYRKLSSLRDQKTLSSWLYRIATNLCYDRFRQSKSRPQISDGVGGLGDEEVFTIIDQDSPRLDSVFDQKEMSACVQSYLEELPDHYRAVIMLHDLEGLTNPEIAEILGCSLATVKIRLHRARRKLGSALSQACQFSVDERGVTVCQPKSSDSDRKRR